MQIRLGYELVYDFPQPTPMMLMLNVHYTRVSDLVAPDHLVTSPVIPIRGYRDGFVNWCNRIVAPTGRTRLSANGIVNDTDEPDVVASAARQHAVEDLPRRGLGVSLEQPVLRDRPAERYRMVAVRQDAARLGPRPGHLRLRSPAHRLRL
jgi:transglutaminase-like putative cysteine protease